MMKITDGGRLKAPVVVVVALAISIGLFFLPGQRSGGVDTLIPAARAAPVQPVAQAGGGRALLIGVGQYRDPVINDLPGIDKDIEMMRKVAGRLGFESVEVLLDEQATRSAVEQTFRQSLIEPATPQDRILIYFSGHGSFIPDTSGDEADGRDEVLVLHDTQMSRQDGGTTLINVLDDDTLGALLDALPSQNVLVLIDACHSGTATKALGDSDIVPKFFRYEGMPVATPGSTKAIALEARGANHLAIGAAADDETSTATADGSWFTLAVTHTVDDSARNGAPLTPRMLQERVTAFIADLADRRGQRPFHPQLTGSDELAGRPLPILTAAAPAAPSTNWQQLERMVAGYAPLTVEANQSNYRLGDAIEISVSTDRPGYLNVITIAEADDQPVVLFPNRYHQDNRVEAGTVTLPTAQMPFVLKAREPLGASITAAFLSTRPVNLYQAGGDMKAVFRQLSRSEVQGLTRAIAVEAAPAADTGVRAGLVRTTVSAQ